MTDSVAKLRRQRSQLLGVAVLLAAIIVVLAFRVGDSVDGAAGHAPRAADSEASPGSGREPDPRQAPSHAPVDLSGPILSEVMASNGATLQDEDGDHPDWVELYNPTGAPVDLGGLFLSDDDGQPARWQLPSVELPPDGRVVVFASGKDRDDPAGELHTDFRLAQGDEPVLLVDRDGVTVLDRLPPADIPRDTSVGREPGDLQRVCYFAVPRPGQPNAPECFDDVELGAPTLSVEGGFYDDAVEVALTSPLDGATILYTLDGSHPDLERNPDRTLVYEEPLTVEDRTGEWPRISTIDTTASEHPHIADRAQRFGMPDLDGVDLPRATVLRARSEYGAERSAVYLVGDAHRRDGLPVVSLTLDPDHLFDHDTGIFIAGATYEAWRDSADHDPEADWRIPTNYNQRGREWERPAQEALWNAVVLDICEPDAGCVHQQQVGIRTHGGFSRTLPQKSIRLYARNDYGDRRIRYAALGEHHPEGHRRLLLRNSGNDNGQLMYADGFLQSIFTDLRADTQAYRPAVLLINGEYWGIQNLRERYDRHYLEVAHGADPDTVQILDNTSGPLDGGDHPEAADEWVAFVENLQPHTVGTSDLRDVVEATIDVDSFFDFLIATVFVGNADSISNNVRLWREPNGPDRVGEGVRDGRWRWMLNDFDQAGGSVGSWDPEFDLLVGRLAPRQDPTYRDGFPHLFTLLMEDQTLRHRFLARFADLLNTDLRPARTTQLQQDLIDVLRDEIPLHSQRWLEPMAEQWEPRGEALATFLEERPDHQRRQLIERFGLRGTADLTVRTDPQGGHVQVNTVEVLTDADEASWSGTYFIDVPITVEAVPEAGYRFVGWRGLDGGDTSDPVVEISPRTDLTLEARFEPA